MFDLLIDCARPLWPTGEGLSSGQEKTLLPLSQAQMESIFFNDAFEEYVRLVLNACTRQMQEAGITLDTVLEELLFGNNISIPMSSITEEKMEEHEQKKHIVSFLIGTVEQMAVCSDYACDDREAMADELLDYLLENQTLEDQRKRLCAVKTILLLQRGMDLSSACKAASEEAYAAPLTKYHINRQRNEVKGLLLSMAIPVEIMQQMMAAYEKHGETEALWDLHDFARNRRLFICVVSALLYRTCAENGVIFGADDPRLLLSSCALFTAENMEVLELIKDVQLGQKVYENTLYALEGVQFGCAIGLLFILADTGLMDIFVAELMGMTGAMLPVLILGAAACVLIGLGLKKMNVRLSEKASDAAVLAAPRMRVKKARLLHAMHALLHRNDAQIANEPVTPEAVYQPIENQAALPVFV